MTAPSFRNLVTTRNLHDHQYRCVAWEEIHAQNQAALHLEVQHLDFFENGARTPLIVSSDDIFAVTAQHPLLVNGTLIRTLGDLPCGEELQRKILRDRNLVAQISQTLTQAEEARAQLQSQLRSGSFNRGTYQTIQQRLSTLGLQAREAGLDTIADACISKHNQMSEHFSNLTMSRWDKIREFLMDRVFIFGT